MFRPQAQDLYVYPDDAYVSSSPGPGTALAQLWHSSYSQGTRPIRHPAVSRASLCSSTYLLPYLEFKVEFESALGQVLRAERVSSE